MSSFKVIILCLILLLILGWRFFSYYQNAPKLELGQKLKLQAVLQQEPKLSGQGQKFSVQTGQNQHIAIRTGLNKLYHYGDSLAIEGQLQVKTVAGGAQIYSLNFPQITLLERENNPLVEASTSIRQKSLRLFQESLPPVSSSLLMGIVFGSKENFPGEFFQKLQSAGVLHVIAASGMNISFFTGAVMFSLGTALKRRIAIICSVFAVIFYSFLVGFEASILRAAIMAIITFTASFFGRQMVALFALIVTGYLMLLWSPAFIFDIGFQLSFMATVGILLLKPLFGAFHRIPFVGEDLVTTGSAQVATTPILLGTFGTIGLLSILVNILVLWTVPILMLLGSLGVLLGLVFVPLGKVLIILCLPFLLYFEQIVSFFGSLNFNLKMDNFPWELGVGYYLILVAAVLHFQKNKKLKG